MLKQTFQSFSISPNQGTNYFATNLVFFNILSFSTSERLITTVMDYQAVNEDHPW